MKKVNFDKCPPIVRQLIEQEGNNKAAAKAIGSGASTINGLASGKVPMSPRLEKKILAGLKLPPVVSAIGHSGAAPEPAPAPVVIPQWDKKTVTVKLVKADGKKESLKLPSLIARLFEMHGNVKGNIAKALGYSSWNGPQTALEQGKYELKLHARAYCAVNGLPVPRSGTHGGTDADASIADAYTLGIAICMVALSEYERLEDISDALGGKLILRMTTGSTGYLVIYRMTHRDKLETFKRLAGRDAKRIVCP